MNKEAKLKKKIAEAKKQLAILQGEKDGFPKREAGMKIQIARKKRGLKQEELANLLGVSRTTLANIEGGKQSMTIKALINICRELRLNANKLLNVR